MLRKIVYGILGFIGGSAIGLMIFAMYFATSVSSDLIFLLLIFVFGIPGLLLSIKLAVRKNIKEEQYSKVENASTHGYLYIVGSILGAQYLVSLVIFIIGFMTLWSLGIGFKDFVVILNQNRFVVTIVGIPLGIVLSWIGVWYVSREGFLKQFHSPLKISLWVIAVSAVLSYQQIFQAPLLFVLFLAVAFCSLYYFLDRAVKS